jgi:hypothetical protein
MSGPLARVGHERALAIAHRQSDRRVRRKRHAPAACGDSANLNVSRRVSMANLERARNSRKDNNRMHIEQAVQGKPDRLDPGEPKRG